MKNIGVEILNHIDCAKDWLDKAALEFKSKNKIKGELILSLAQAEVKHAWEESVSGGIKKANPKYARARYRIASVAAALFIFLNISGLVYYFSLVKPRVAQKPEIIIDKPVPEVRPDIASGQAITHPPVPEKSAEKKSEGKRQIFSQSEEIVEEGPGAINTNPAFAVKEAEGNKPVEIEKNISESIDWNKLESTVRDILKGN